MESNGSGRGVMGCAGVGKTRVGVEITQLLLLLLIESKWLELELRRVVVEWRKK